VKVVSHGIIIKCCETTFKVAITRKAYAFLTVYRKRNDLQLTSALQSNTIHPKDTPFLWQPQTSISAQETFHPLMVPLAAWVTIEKEV
jgi:hypothetical protein